MKKYRFTGETMTIDNVIILQRIQRISDGLVGGWIESAKNLSHEGNCFVYDESCVLDYAEVTGDAEIRGNSVICDLARVEGSVVLVDAIVDGDAHLQGPPP